jgi:hypothetical protein
MPDISYDLHYVTLSLGELKPYLLSKELFWPLRLNPIHGKPSSVKLTPGNLLLSFARLNALHHSKKMSTKQESELLKLKRDFDVLKSKWAVAWEKKVTHEFTSRLRQWRLYLNEVERDAKAHAPYYATEVRLRVLLELLRDDLAEVPETDLSSLDDELRSHFIPGDFIWDADLAPGFPQEKYWHLWGNPKDTLLQN